MSWPAALFPTRESGLVHWCSGRPSKVSVPLPARVQMTSSPLISSVNLSPGRIVPGSVGAAPHAGGRWHVRASSSHLKTPVLLGARVTRTEIPLETPRVSPTLGSASSALNADTVLRVPLLAWATSAQQRRSGVTAFCCCASRLPVLVIVGTGHQAHRLAAACELPWLLRSRDRRAVLSTRQRLK